jgi:hypothetical protein
MTFPAFPPILDLHVHPRHRHVRRPGILEEVNGVDREGWHHACHSGPGFGGARSRCRRVLERVRDRAIFELLLDDGLGDKCAGSTISTGTGTTVGDMRTEIQQHVLAKDVQVPKITGIDLEPGHFISNKSRHWQHVTKLTSIRGAPPLDCEQPNPPDSGSSPSSMDRSGPPPPAVSS